MAELLAVAVVGQGPFAVDQAEVVVVVVVAFDLLDLPSSGL